MCITASQEFTYEFTVFVLYLYIAVTAIIMLYTEYWKITCKSALLSHRNKHIFKAFFTSSGNYVYGIFT